LTPTQTDRAHLVRITGSLAEIEPASAAFLYELVRVGERGLLGEVVRIEGERATAQIYEDTTGLRLGEPAELTGESLVAELGPGLLGAVLDGVGRPLPRVAEVSGDLLQPGVHLPSLDPDRAWKFEARLQPGTEVSGGDVLGVVAETPGIEHRVLVPPELAGRLAALESGSFKVGEPIGRLADDTPLYLAHRWPVRRPRPYARRLPTDLPFVTGQRIMDLLFPVAEGGSVAVPGGFGTGKTVIEQSLAKYASADVIVYIGCGERGNEMAEVLDEFPRLDDPRTGGSLMDRSILVVNTSNMPVAARESSVYLGITIAEYYRDMGYRVAVMADSLSRWAEALRELGSRLQEMPGEEGYPTYLGNRMAKYFERAGRVTAAGTPERSGALTFIAAISPPGGDFSEPVTQAALRVTGGLWALDPALAHSRQFPAVDWQTSYSLYADACAPWFEREVAEDWEAVRNRLFALLDRERDLREIAGLIGAESMQDEDRLLLEAAALIRELVLGQNAFDERDALSPLAKSYALAALAEEFHEQAGAAVRSGRALEDLDLGAVRQALNAVRYASPEGLDERVAEARKAIAHSIGKNSVGEGGA